MAPSASPARRRSLATSWPPRCAQVRDKKKQSNEQRTPRGRASVDRSESRPIAFHAPSSSHASLSLSLSFSKLPQNRPSPTSSAPLWARARCSRCSWTRLEVRRRLWRWRKRRESEGPLAIEFSAVVRFTRPSSCLNPPVSPPPKKTKLLQNQIQASCSPTTAMPSSVKSTCRILRPR